MIRRTIMMMAMLLVVGLTSCTKDPDLPIGYFGNYNGGGSGGGSTNDSFTVSVSASPSNGGTVTGGGTYSEGQSCTVKASSKPNFIFVNWTENGNQVSGLAEYSFTVTGNRNLVANFEAQAPTEYTINVSANPNNGGTVTGGGTYSEGQSCMVTATPDSGYTFSKWTENGNEVSTDASYSFTVTGNRTLVANFTLTGGSYNGHDYVDLGLPSGTLWATCNVGANAPEDYGYYYAWGETTTKSTYDWSTYKYCKGSYNMLTKYCNNSSYGYNGFTDNLTVLQSGDDAATANWGSGWRMPTEEEFEELYNNTTVMWMTQNGVNGRLLTASNGASLFLPAAGYRYSSSLNDAGSNGCYRSSSLYTDRPSYNAWELYFDLDYYSMGYSGRDCGRSVRPVRVGSQN